jgi:hypothetical protein
MSERAPKSRPMSCQRLDAVDRANALLMAALLHNPFWGLMVAQILSIIVTEADYRTKLRLLSRHNVSRLSYIHLDIVKCAYI